MPSPMIAAKRGTLTDFQDSYAQHPHTDPNSLLFPALANRDPHSRVEIATWLLENGADPAAIDPRTRHNALHILFSQTSRDAAAEAPLVRRLLAGGADINGHSPCSGVPLFVLHQNTRSKDPVMGPVYDAVFATPGINWDAPADSTTLREVVEHGAVRKPEFTRRMRDYIARGPAQ